MTPEKLLNIYPKARNTDAWAHLMDGVLEAYGIDTVNKQAMFLAQTMHETAGFRYLKEIWGPSSWQKKYEGHVGLGNTEPGDGKKFLGRGLIQCTGRKNYQLFANWMRDQRIMDNPAVLAEDIGLALLSAIWYWNNNNLSDIAESDNIERCTRIINGPVMLGLTERRELYERAKQVLRVSI